MSAPQSKNAVSTNIKHSRCIHLMSNLLSIHFHTKRLHVHMFDEVDTPFNYGKVIACSSLQEFSTPKESNLHVIWNVDTAFLLCGTDVCFRLHTVWFKINLTLVKTHISHKWGKIRNLFEDNYKPWYLGRMWPKWHQKWWSNTEIGALFGQTVKNEFTHT